MWHATPVSRLQWLAMPQPGGAVHAAPSVEHVPPTSGQVVVQSAPVALHVLLRSQSGLLAKHAGPLAVQWPGWAGHSAGPEPAGGGEFPAGGAGGPVLAGPRLKA